jgi:hypothetical protein
VGYQQGLTWIPYSYSNDNQALPLWNLSGVKVFMIIPPLLGAVRHQLRNLI